MDAGGGVARAGGGGGRRLQVLLKKICKKIFLCQIGRNNILNLIHLVLLLQCCVLRL